MTRTPASKKMNFNSSVKLVAGDAIPPNSIALLYSPHCGHCHKIVPQFNALSATLSAGGVKNIEIVAVDVSREFSSLRAGGISVPHVPLVLIKTPTSIIEYQGTRMATEIASEAAKVLAGGETVPAPDALLGGAAAEVVPPIEGGRRSASGVHRSHSRRSRRVGTYHVRGHRSNDGHGHYFDIKPYNVSRRRSRRFSHSRIVARRRNNMGGGEAEAAPIAGGEAAAPTEVPIVGGEIEGGRRRRHRSRSRRSRMRGGEEAPIVGGEIEGGRRRRSRRSRSRRSRVRGGKAPIVGGEVAPVVSEVAPIVGGEVLVAEVPASVAPIVGGSVAPIVSAPIVGGRRRRSRRSRSRRSRVRGGAEALNVPIAGGEIEGGRRRRSRRSRSRRSRMRGGDEITGGKIAGGKTAWQTVMSEELLKVGGGKSGFKRAVAAAQRRYY